MNILDDLKNKEYNTPRDRNEVGKPNIFNRMPEYDSTKQNTPQKEGILKGIPNKESYKKNPYSTSLSNPTQENNKRNGMSATAWKIVFSATEIILDVIKSGIIIFGIISANLADFIMGSIGISLITNTKINSLTFVNGFGFGSILSMGSSAIQIYMWSLIQKRGISTRILLNPKLWYKIPKDIQGFLGMALFLWVIDTVLDVSPTFVLFTNENFLHMQWLYVLLVSGVMIIVTILCGFAEILTSNMRGMLAGEQ